MKEKAQHLVQAVRRWPFAVWCLLTTVAGGLYLSITLVAPLGGDDCINNLSKAVAVRQQPFWELLGEELAGIWNGLTLQEGRFFPFYFPFSRINWLFCGSVDSYRLYIIIYTLATAAVLALLVHRLTGSRRAALSFFCTDAAHVLLVERIFCQRHVLLRGTAAGDLAGGGACCPLYAQLGKDAAFSLGGGNGPADLYLLRYL